MIEPLSLCQPRFYNTHMPAITTVNLSKTYQTIDAVNQLDLTIPAGQFFGLLGPNGSGKTTTIHMLATLVRPTQGTAYICGHDVTQAAVAVRQQIGLVFQESALDRTLTVAENLQFAGALYGLPTALIKQRMTELLTLFNLTECLERPVGQLSGGMRRAVDIARGMLHHPKVLLLDEPTLGLDVINRRKIWRFVDLLRRELGITVLVTTHYLEEAQVCEQVVFIRNGQVVGQGSPTALIESLGETILEIQSEEAPKLLATLSQTLADYQIGNPIQDGDTLLFRLNRSDVPLETLQHHRWQGVIQKLQFRQPDLNDVYIWLNHSPEVKTG